MSDLSRRNFLATGAAAAGAVVVVGQLGDGTAAAVSKEAGTEPNGSVRSLSHPNHSSSTSAMRPRAKWLS